MRVTAGAIWQCGRVTFIEGTIQALSAPRVRVTVCYHVRNRRVRQYATYMRSEYTRMTRWLTRDQLALLLAVNPIIPSVCFAHSGALIDMRASFLAALLLPAFFVKAQNDPQVTVNRFENLPARLFFFDDATVRPNISTSRDAPRPLFA
jgi:hypothetical protein